jgi:outer membrane protein assembly factor BamB
MTRARDGLVYVGIKNNVVALDRRTGAEVWRTLLPAKYKSVATLVNVVLDSEGLVASCAGEVFALDPRDGTLLWHEPFKGLGTELATIVTDLGGETPQSVVLEAARKAQQASQAAAAGAG